MSSLHGDKEVHRSGTGVLTIGKDIGYDTTHIDEYGFEHGTKDFKVMLINPPVSFDMFYGSWDLSDVKSSSPPIGILSLAAVIRKYGYEVNVLDAHAEGLTIDQIVKEVDSFRPQVVGLTAMTVMISASAEIAKAVKKYNKSITTIIGGVHVTAEPIETLKRYPQFDYAVVGEGEIVLTEFLEKVRKQAETHSIHSLVWRGNGDINVNQRRAFFKSLDEFPMPAFDLVPNLFNHYRLSIFGTKKFRSVGLVTSRGCSGKCHFCDLGVVGRGFRYHTAEYLIQLMKDLNSKYNVSDFLFYDDLFVGSRPRLKAICETIINEKLPFTWSCCARADFLHPDMMDLMKKAGCWMIEVGIESGCQRLIDSMRKNVTKERIAECVNSIGKAGIISKGNFIFALPGETHDSILETIDFACSLTLNYAQHTFMTPLPGSEAYEMAGKYGEFNNSWDEMNTFKINYLPDGLTRDQLISYSKLFWRKFYLRPHIMWHELKKLRTVEDLQRLWLAFKAFVKTVIYKRKLPEFVQRQTVNAH